MGKSTFIHQVDPASEYFFREGCHILEYHNHPDDEEASIARARVEPGVRTRKHRLAATIERYFILEGEGEAFLGDQVPEYFKLNPPGMVHEVIYMFDSPFENPTGDSVYHSEHQR